VVATWRKQRYKTFLKFCFVATIKPIKNWIANSDSTWDRCYDFLNIFAKKIQRKNWRFCLKEAKICKIVIITLVFEKNAIFSPKIGKNRRKW
jgi:hypothetical protein